MPEIMNQIADLHCDLLAFLSRSPTHTPYDLAVRCAIPQLQQGHVKIQTLALFTETAAGSHSRGRLQAQIFKSLQGKYPDTFQFLRSAAQIEQQATSDKIGILAAIENSSIFCEEQDALDLVFVQLERMLRKIGKPAYISLTWNTENRFGGGAATDIGLKNDGKRLIEYLVRRQTPLDFSHASDRLAFEVLDFLAKENLHLPLIASHSNMRAVTNVSRNLPDDLAKEIMKSGGIIGLNFFRPFLESSSSLAQAGQVEHFFQHLHRLLSLNGADHVCFGADFFHDDDLSPKYRAAGIPLFFSSFADASSYPRLLEAFRSQLFLPDALVNNIAFGNVARFLSRIL